MTADHAALGHAYDLTVAAETIDRLVTALDGLGPADIDKTVTICDVRDWLTGQARRARQERDQ